MRKFSVYIKAEGKGTETVTVMAEKVTVAAEGGVTFFAKSTIVAYFTPPNFTGFISEEAMPVIQR